MQRLEVVNQIMTGSFSHRKDFPRHKKIKKRSMQLSFRVYHISRGSDNQESIMDTRKGKMGHMIAHLMEGTGQIGITQSYVVDGQIHLTGKVVFMDFILVPYQRENMVIIAITLQKEWESILAGWVQEIQASYLWWRVDETRRHRSIVARDEEVLQAAWL